MKNNKKQLHEALAVLLTKFYRTSRGFRLATSEATIMNKDVEPIFV